VFRHGPILTFGVRERCFCGRGIEEFSGSLERENYIERERTRKTGLIADSDVIRSDHVPIVTGISQN
jgi:hypothetical protein